MNVNFTKRLVGVLRDFQDNQNWKYDELSPVQMLEKLTLDKRLAARDELERAEFFWARRPRFLRSISWPPVERSLSDSVSADILTK